MSTVKKIKHNIDGLEFEYIPEDIFESEDFDYIERGIDGYCRSDEYCEFMVRAVRVDTGEECLINWTFDGCDYDDLGSFDWSCFDWDDWRKIAIDYKERLNNQVALCINEAIAGYSCEVTHVFNSNFPHLIIKLGQEYARKNIDNGNTEIAIDYDLVNDRLVLGSEPNNVSNCGLNSEDEVKIRGVADKFLEVISDNQSGLYHELKEAIKKERCDEKTF